MKHMILYYIKPQSIFSQEFSHQTVYDQFQEVISEKLEDMNDHLPNLIEDINIFLGFRLGEECVQSTIKKT